jgi:acyl-CoA synthetase (AMP-forming)/AMP-acid ligase II
LPIDNFFRAAALWPERIAVEIAHANGCQQISYAALADMTRAMAAGLQAIDPQPQSRVGICAYNNFEHLLALLGCFSAGKVWVSLNPRNGQEELNRVIDVTDPSVIVFNADCADKFDRKTAQLISANGTHERVDHHIDNMLDRYRGAQLQTFQASLNDLQAIKFTSGSTGMPKGVMQS